MSGETARRLRRRVCANPHQQEAPHQSRSPQRVKREMQRRGQTILGYRAPSTVVLRYAAHEPFLRRSLAGQPAERVSAQSEWIRFHVVKHNGLGYRTLRTPPRGPSKVHRFLVGRRYLTHRLPTVPVPRRRRGSLLNRRSRRGPEVLLSRPVACFGVYSGRQRRSPPTRVRRTARLENHRGSLRECPTPLVP